MLGTEMLSPKSRHRANMCILGALNAGSIFVAINLLINLNPEDSISVRRGFALTTLGFVYFTTLFEALNSLALLTSTGAKLRQKYRLSCYDVLDINNKLVSAVQAAFCCVTGAIVCLYSCTRDLLRSSHFISEAYAWFGAAYFFYDIWSMYVVHVQQHSGGEYYKARVPRKLSKRSLAEAEPAADGRRASFLAWGRAEPVILFHHLFIGGFGFLVIVWLRGGLGDCVFGFVYLMELSTPFVSLRGVLSRLRLKRSRAYVANGLLMLLTFFACRVCSLPAVFALYARQVGLPYFRAVAGLPAGCLLSVAILLFPQLYWFALMSAGAVKVFRGGAQGAAPSALSAGDALAARKAS